MAQDLDVVRTPDVGEGMAAATLATLLSVTSDAVVCFNDEGIILLANDEALNLLAPAGVSAEHTSLVGLDVRLLFPPAVDTAPDAPFTIDALPLATDGSTTRLTYTDASGHTATLVSRCERVPGPHAAYLLAAHPDTTSLETSRERERLIEELSRANKRLSGTLDIVLGTLDSPSMGTLFERVLEELCETMDATGTAVYLSERNGFYLRGTSASLEGVALPRYLSRRATLPSVVIHSERSVRFRVLPPTGDSLRKGKLAYREVLDEELHTTYRVRATQLPPFTSFLAVPVRFSGQVIAFIEVGWRSARAIPRDDADLLDAVTRYLAVQLVGAFTALRAQRREQLSLRASELRDALVAEPFSESTSTLLLDAVSRDLNCSCCLVEGPSALVGYELVQLPVASDQVTVPSELFEEDEEGVSVVSSSTPLGSWLRDQGEPCLGAFVDTGGPADTRVRFLALRPGDAEPFDDLELEYLRQVVDTVRAVSRGEQGRQHDHRISQALQSGMRSELQQVKGISAQGIYSSATEAAFVGGDFYDLISLPERRACVIMGDVSGKGVEAASVSAAVRTALGAYSWEGLAPAHMVSLLNEFLLGFAGVETFATLFVGVINLAQGHMAYCSAGHPPALLRRAQTGEIEWLGEQSGVVGAFHDMAYRDGHMNLYAGDVLLLYTDGTTEARAADGRFFGEDGLRDAVVIEGERGFEGLLDRLLATVDRFTGNSLDDDVAMVALRFDEVGPVEAED